MIFVFLFQERVPGLKSDRQVFTLGDLWGRDTTILLAWGGHAMGG